MKVVAQRGFDATVIEIAESSGVSPRTIFRHYKSQIALIAATLQDMFEAGNRPIDGLPRPNDDLDGWLEGLTLALHTRGVQIFGEVIWDLLRAPGAAHALKTLLQRAVDEQNLAQPDIAGAAGAGETEN